MKDVLIEADRLRVALTKLCALALTCERTNTDWFMRLLVERCNDACEALNDPDRFEFYSGSGKILKRVERREAP